MRELLRELLRLERELRLARLLELRFLLARLRFWEVLLALVGAGGVGAATGSGVAGSGVTSGAGSSLASGLICRAKVHTPSVIAVAN